MNSEAMRSIEVAAGGVWPAACPATTSENVAAIRDDTAIRRASRLDMVTSGRKRTPCYGNPGGDRIPARFQEEQ